MRMKILFTLALLALLSVPSWALLDTNVYRITFNAPVDTTFISGDSIDVNISVFDQADRPLSGAVPILTVRTIGGGAVTILTDTMTDNGGGAYGYAGINVSAYNNTNLELRVRIDVKGTAVEDRRYIYHGTAQNPAAATTAWKLVFVSPQPAISADTSTVISVNLYNEAGALWSGQTVNLTVLDSSGGFVAMGAMTSQGNGLYSDTLNGAQLNAGQDYVIRAALGFGAGGGGGVRTAILAEAYTSIMLPVLIPVSPDPTTNPRPTLRWHEVSGAAVYTLQIDTNPGFANPIINTPLADTFYNPLLDLPADVIYWRVSSDLAPGRFSAAESFTILDASIPVLIPYAPDPTQERRPTLTWHAVSGAANYTIQIDTLMGSFGGAVISSPTSDTFFTPGIDLPMRTIYWRVRSDRSATYSRPDTFTILVDSIPMLVRFNGDTVGTFKPTFQWHPVSGATYYTIQISLVRSFLTTVISTPTSDTFYTPLINLDTSTLYFWRVSCSRNNNLYSSRDSVFIGTGGPAAERGAAGAPRLSLAAAPNPFSGVTVITLSGAEKGPVALQVLDVSGRVVKTLTLENARAALEMRRSGIYFIRARVGTQILTERILMLK